MSGDQRAGGREGHAVAVRATQRQLVVAQCFGEVDFLALGFSGDIGPKITVSFCVLVSVFFS